MEPVEIRETVEGWTLVTYAKHQAEYSPLPTIVADDNPEGRTISRWRPTAEELLKLLAGEDLYLEVLTFGNTCKKCGTFQGLQPVKIGVWSDRIACVDGAPTEPRTLDITEP